MAYEPDLFPNQGRANMAGKFTFHLRVIYGSSAITSYKGKHLTVVDVSAGNMTITFPRPYRELIGFRWGWAKLGAGAVYFPVILTDAMATTGILTLETRTEAGTATDPATGSELLLEFDTSLEVLNDDRLVTL